VSRSKVKGQGHRGKKMKKCGILFTSRPLGRGPRAAFFFGSDLRGRSPAVVSSATSTPVGKSAHAVYFIKFIYISYIASCVFNRFN